MIRPFDWRDLTLLRRLGERGLCLDSQLAHTRGPQTLQHALLDALSPGKTTSTLVARPESRELETALGQVVLSSSDRCARLTYLGPQTALAEPHGLRLVEALAQEAGRHGALNLIADVDEDIPAFESLRGAGFAIYARQRIWRLPEAGNAGSGGRAAVWRPQLAADATALSILYVNLVPGLVQQVEPAPHPDSRDLVHWQDGELLGYLDVERGPLGTLVRPYFHPAAEGVEGLLISYLSRQANRRGRPLYFAVRSYQGWIGSVLERLGFEPAQDQAMMVKRLAVGVRRPALAPLRSVEGKFAEPSAPFSRIEESAPSPPHAAGR
ncbi:MAG TPA: hypothetical protein VJ123_04000 [Anaerolineales bacterium]|nr:hypothetical protein [Anaerolineales bacterium]